MGQGEVVLALHFFEAAGGAFEGFGAFTVAVELVGGGFGAGDELDAVVVEGVDERDEAAGFVVIVGGEAGDRVQDEGVEMGGQRQVVAGAERGAAEGREVEAGDAGGGKRDVQRATHDYQAVRVGGGAAGELAEGVIQGGVGSGAGGDVPDGHAAKAGASEVAVAV